jgi:hypothetical protein
VYLPLVDRLTKASTGRWDDPTKPDLVPIGQDVDGVTVLLRKKKCSIVFKETMFAMFTPCLSLEIQRFVIRKGSL